jgi:hypothetical protein
MRKLIKFITPFLLVLGLLTFMSNFKYSETLSEKEKQAIETEISKIENNVLTSER